MRGDGLTMRRDERGYTKFEFTAVIIMVAVVVLIALPLWLNFQEQERRAMDRLEAVNAESAARTEYMMSHWPGNEKVMYLFTGENEVCRILRHAPCESSDYASLTPPARDLYNDGGDEGSGQAAKARSRKLGDTPLIVVVSGEGEISYNSWKEVLAGGR